MQKELSLQKLNHIDFLSGSHTKRIDTAYEDICGKVDLLRKIRDAQLDADHWRIVMAPGSCEDALRRNAAMAYCKAG